MRYETITRLLLSGQMPEAALKAHAKRLRDGLLTRGIDKVDLFGSRDEEIWVEVKERPLRRLDLTLADISDTRSSPNEAVTHPSTIASVKLP